MTVVLLTIFCQLAFSGKDAILLNQVTNIKARNGRLQKSVSYEIQINSRAGEEWTDIAIPFSQSSRISKLTGEIRDLSGRTIRTLKKGEITERSEYTDENMYNDNYLKEFSLKNNQYPYIIYYSYQIEEDEFVTIESWNPVLDCRTPTLKATLTLEAPQDYQISVLSGKINRSLTDTAEKVINYTWETSFKDVFDEEPYSPRTLELTPYVLIIPVKFTYDTSGSSESWSSFGNWQSLLLDQLSDLSEPQKQKMRNLTIQAYDEKEKVRILYHYLQDETRYIAVSISSGRLIPFPASYVTSHGYGDCKALANYFRSMLRAVGIDSYYTLVYGGIQPMPIDTFFHSAQHFNHVIVIVPTGPDTLWLDCTSKGPFGYQDSFTQNRWALVVNGTKSKLVRTPALSLPDVCTSSKIRIWPGSSGGLANAEIRCLYKGEAFEQLLYLSKSYNEGIKDRFIRKHFANGGLTINDFELQESDRDDPAITLSVNAVTDRTYKIYGNEMIIHVNPIQLPDFSEPADRKIPVQFDLPIYTIDTLEYTPPTGFEFRDYPADRSIKSPYGSFEVKVKGSTDKAYIIKSFQLFPGRIEIEKYNSFYEFIKQIKDIEKNIVLTGQKTS